MASLMQELLEVLEQEEKQYEKLIELNDIKRDSVIKANIDELGKVTTQEQEIASVLLNLSNKRGGILNDMATVLGKEPKDMTINKMIGYLESQPEEQKLLIERRDRLLEVGTQMRMLNQQNEALLNQALEMVEFDLTLLRSMRQAPETANYNRNAYNTGDLLGSSGFDAKQ
ncbi:MAG: flagellar export chaperone FlgN [Roseburia sp.]|nr:flagellar export chaperone FlgN [Roseburia sp.]